MVNLKAIASSPTDVNVLSVESYEPDVIAQLLPMILDATCDGKFIFYVMVRCGMCSNVKQNLNYSSVKHMTEANMRTLNRKVANILSRNCIS